jgi:putative ABC transport system substrate-binding protein
MIGVIVDPTGPTSDAQRTDLQDAASTLGLQPIFLNASNEHEIDAAFATLVQRRIEALLLTDSTFFNGRREQLVTLARFNAIPTMYTFREFVVAGGLISYASSLTDIFHLPSRNFIGSCSRSPNKHYMLAWSDADESAGHGSFLDLVPRSQFHIPMASSCPL